MYVMCRNDNSSQPIWLRDATCADNFERECFANCISTCPTEGNTSNSNCGDVNVTCSELQIVCMLYYFHAQAIISWFIAIACTSCMHALSYMYTHCVYGEWCMQYFIQTGLCMMVLKVSMIF